MKNSRRGFALPLAITLVVVCTTILAVLLEGQTAQLYTTQRQLDAYRMTHATRGIGEAVDAWIRHQQANSVAEALGRDGLAFDLSTDDGQLIHVYLTDGQGLALSDLSGLTGDSLETGRDILHNLVETHRARANVLVRRDGPLAVSVNTAPPEVLDAVIEAASEGASQSLTAEIVSARNAVGGLDGPTLQKMIMESTVPDEVKPRLTALLTANTALWHVDAIAVDHLSGHPVAHFRASALITRAVGAAVGDRNSSVDRPVSLFGWESLEVR